MMYVVLAENHDRFEDWLNHNFVYVGDEESLSRLDPKKVQKILFIGDFRRHPIYFSDAFLEFQMAVALANRGLKVRVTGHTYQTWWQRFLKWVGF